MADDKQAPKPSIFKSILSSAGDALLDYQIKKAAAGLTADAVKKNDDEIEYYAKAVVDDPSYTINSNGFKDKATRISNAYLKSMSYRDSAIAAVIQTRLNQVSNHSTLVKAEHQQGWMLKLKNEEQELEKIKKQLQKKQAKELQENDPGLMNEIDQAQDQDVEFNKAFGEDQSKTEDSDPTQTDADPSKDPQQSQKANQSDDEVEEVDFELERKAKQMLNDKFEARRKKAEQFILNAGLVDGRPYESKKWNFNTCLRAWCRDSLTYDFIATEVVPDHKNDPHHFFPIDGGTIKFSNPSLKNWKDFSAAQTNVDLLYPEKQIEALDNRGAFELDETKLENEEYKFVQVVKGRIERAYTADECKVGIRNIVTDIYQNGYGLAELELLVALVSSHINAEYYNQAYFTQGFSAKGILHLKAPINRRKLETIRQQWQHMLKGAKNSFQTPIFAGMDEVNWIPLTQNHDDIGFQGWMGYIIKMICGIYQIDPHEIGIGMKDEGGKGGGLNGDNTDEKVKMSKDKGLLPLLRFFETYINDNILPLVDDAFELHFTGVTEESKEQALKRQESESKFLKTVNELREEAGLPPLPGMDDFILSPVYTQWYDKYSKKGQALAKQTQDQQMKQQQASLNGKPGMGDDEKKDEIANVPSVDEVTQMLDIPDEIKPEDVAKSFSIEYFKPKK